MTAAAAKSRLTRPTHFALLLLALGALNPLFQTGCKSYVLTDPATGQTRLATTEEMVALWGPTAIAAGEAAALAVPPPWQPFAQLGIQALALTLAWFTKTRAETTPAAKKAKGAQ